jgi:hypothetical protein
MADGILRKMAGLLVWALQPIMRMGTVETPLMPAGQTWAGLPQLLLRPKFLRRWELHSYRNQLKFRGAKIKQNTGT